MPRWQPDARERLEHAAIALFLERGFAATTVPEITARAGLTTRTFFRYFADKREVLYAGEEIPLMAARMIASAPPSLSTAELILGGLQTVAEQRFDGRREEIGSRRDIIRSDDSLRERDLHKRASLSDAIRVGLIDRGLDPQRAQLLGESTVTVLYVAVDEWLDQDVDTPLMNVIRETIGALQDVANALT